MRRRRFLAHTLVATGAFALRAHSAPPESPPSAPLKIIGFSKPFAHLGPEETADLVAEVGWDGIECPVRVKAGQIAPERVEEDLPRMVEALQKRGKELTIVTTEITRVDPLAEKILRTAARLGIKKYRLGFAYYTADKSIPDTLREVGAALRDLAALNRELGLQGGWQNHSGANLVGAPLWDIWTIIKDLDPRDMGVCFDLAHATIEGGLSWPLQARLMAPHFVAVFLKDFRWEKTAKGWEPVWCHLGDGMIHPSFVTQLAAGHFAGPICQHHEYKDLGQGPAMISQLKSDFEKLQTWLP